MECQGNPQTGRRLTRPPEEIFSAGVDLCRREKSSNAAVLRSVMLLDEAHSALQATEAGLLVPGVLHLFTVVGVPAAGAVAQPHVEPHTDAVSLPHGLLGVRADLHHGGAAGPQQL